MDVLREKVIQATCVGIAASGLHLFLLSEHLDQVVTPVLPSSVWCWLLADTGGKRSRDSVLPAFGLGSHWQDPFKETRI